MYREGILGENGFRFFLDKSRCRVDSSKCRVDFTKCRVDFTKCRVVKGISCVLAGKKCRNRKHDVGRGAALDWAAASQQLGCAGTLSPTF